MLGVACHWLLGDKNQTPDNTRKVTEQSWLCAGSRPQPTKRSSDGSLWTKRVGPTPLRHAHPRPPNGPCNASSVSWVLSVEKVRGCCEAMWCGLLGDKGTTAQYQKGFDG